ncbi:hypothetical protein ACQKP5_12325 [Pseudomonas vancouverensis]|uniref:hypothetical protein n=1 Tax=Pseudomonas vancouverensis TaxID=95300 RepID=UPI003D066556
MPTAPSEIRAITHLSVPVWHVVCDGVGNQQKPDIDLYDLLMQLEKTHPLGSRLLACACRGVALDRLDSVLQHGIDVWPTDHPIFVADWDKALEYGDWPKLLLLLHHDQLRPTWHEVSATLDPGELNELRKTHPHQLVSTDGSKLWLTRFDPDAPQAGTDYEAAYGRYIPGNPFDALAAVLIFAPASWQL